MPRVDQDSKAQATTKSQSMAILEQALKATETDPVAVDTYPEIQSAILQASRPELGMLAAIASRKVVRPDVPAGAIQGTDGRDARSIAKAQVPILRRAFAEAGSRQSVSNEPGVSNQFRESDIDSEWIARRRGGKFKESAGRMFAAVSKIDRLGTEAEREQAMAATASAIWRLARSSALHYPVPARPRSSEVIERVLIFVAEGTEGIRLESVVAALAKSVAAPLMGCDETVVTGVNVDSRFDALTKRQGEPVAIFEATQKALDLDKIEGEVLRGMKETGARQAFVFATQPVRGHEEQIEAFVNEQYMRNDRRIEILELAPTMKAWFAIGHQDDHAIRSFLESVGDGLDEYGSAEDRKAWRDLLAEFDD